MKSLGTWMKTKTDADSPLVYRLKAIWAPVLVYPVRAIPIFESTDRDDTASYVQVTNENDLVAEFVKISASEIRRGRLIKADPATTWPGQPAFHGVIVSPLRFLMSNSLPELEEQFVEFLDNNLDELQKDYPIAALEASRNLAESKHELFFAMSATKRIKSVSQKVAIDWLETARLSDEVRTKCLSTIRHEEGNVDDLQNYSAKPLILQTLNFSIQHSYEFPSDVEVCNQNRTVDIFEFCRDLRGSDQGRQILIFMTWMEGTGILRDLAKKPNVEVHVFSKHGEWSSQRGKWDPDLIVHTGRQGESLEYEIGAKMASILAEIQSSSHQVTEDGP